MTPDLGTIIRELHDSEINGGVTWFYDGCWDMTLGDPLNGIVAKSHELTIADAAEWLRATAVARYPDSVFARKWRRGFE